MGRHHRGLSGAVVLPASRRDRDGSVGEGAVGDDDWRLPRTWELGLWRSRGSWSMGWSAQPSICSPVPRP